MQSLEAACEESEVSDVVKGGATDQLNCNCFLCLLDLCCWLQKFLNDRFEFDFVDYRKDSSLLKEKKIHYSKYFSEKFLVLY